MKETDIDQILDRAAGTPPAVDPALLSRVSASMADLRPVRPLAPVWMLVSGLLLISAAIAIAYASSIGLYGIQKLSGAQIGTIFPTLAILTWLAAAMSVAEMMPGSKRWMHPAALLAVALLGYIAVDAVLFHDYRLGRFVPQGISCLRAGLVVATPTGVASWWMLRRGFAVNPSAAGLAAGTLAGLAGVTMLAFHCPNFLALHVMVWHAAVIPIGAAAGAWVARALACRDGFSRRPS